MAFSNGPLHTDEVVLDDQRELIYKNSVRTQDVVLKTCWKRWMIETNGERESGKSVPARHDDNDDDDDAFPSGIQTASSRF